jgi:hypothetical protein
MQQDFELKPCDPKHFQRDITRQGNMKRSGTATFAHQPQAKTRTICSMTKRAKAPSKEAEAGEEPVCEYEAQVGTA